MNAKVKSKSSAVLFVIPAVIFLDQISKIIARNYFMVSFNAGLVLGLDTGKFGSFIIPLITLCALLFILYKEKNNEHKFALSLILGGGLSNLIDRVFVGCVRDFIRIGIFPSFNFADSTITVGVFLIFYILIFSKRNKPNEI